MFGPIHHVGMVIRDLEGAAGHFAGLGYERRGATVEDERQQVEIVFLGRRGAGAGEPLIELIRPCAETSVVHRFTTRNEYPIHHVCFSTGDVQAAVQEAQRRRLLVVQRPVPAPALGGSLIAFIYSREIGLFELVERPPF